MDNINYNILVKKLLYQSKNRGMKETTVILTKFANKFLFVMKINELLDYEKILQQNDIDLYNWITCKVSVPDYINPDIIQQLTKLY